MTTPPIAPTIQAAKPFEPFQIPAPKPFAPVLPANPAPGASMWNPVADRAETQVQAAPPAANGNNLWNVFNELWKPQYKAPAPSLFQNALEHKPLAPSVLYTQPKRPAAHVVGPFQTNIASSSLQYDSNNNRPFQAQTQASQLGFNSAPRASFDIAPGPIAGTYQGQLDTLNSGGGTSFILIDGRPYAIRRVINRYNNAFTPGNTKVAHFQPFPRFGPGFLRGDQIPHVIRQALLPYGRPAAPPQHHAVITGPIITQPQTISSVVAQRQPSVQSTQQKITGARTTSIRPNANRQATKAAAQRFRVAKPVVKPNYMQLYSNYLRAREKNNHWRPAAVRNSRPIARQNTYRPNTGQSAVDKILQYYSNRYTNRNNQVNSARLANSRHSLPSREASSPGVHINPGGRYVVSIKGTPGSPALEAIRNKAVTNPGFLSGLLSGRSTQYSQQNKSPQIGQRRMMAMRKPQRMPIKTYRPPIVNRPQTDRALIRAKIIRPEVLRRTQWPVRSKSPLTPRGSIAYVPQSAFSRLPPWYRPKIGPALVKYVVKTKEASKPLPEFASGNKKQAMGRPTTQDVWKKIYNYYNNKNAGQANQRSFSPNGRPSYLARAPYNGRPYGVHQPAQKAVVAPVVPPTIQVGSPVFRVRNMQQSNGNIASQRSQNPSQYGGSLKAYQSNGNIASHQSQNPSQYVGRINAYQSNRNVASQRSQSPSQYEGGVNAYQNNANARSNENTNSEVKPLDPDTVPFVDKTQDEKAGGKGNMEIPAEAWDKRSHIRSFVISKKNKIPQRPTLAGNWGTLKKKRSTNHKRHKRHTKNYDNVIHLYARKRREYAGRNRLRAVSER